MIDSNIFANSFEWILDGNCSDKNAGCCNGKLYDKDTAEDNAKLEILPGTRQVGYNASSSLEYKFERNTRSLSFSR